MKAALITLFLASSFQIQAVEGPSRNNLYQVMDQIDLIGPLLDEMTYSENWGKDPQEVTRDFHRHISKILVQAYENKAELSSLERQELAFHKSRLNEEASDRSVSETSEEADIRVGSLDLK